MKNATVPEEAKDFIKKILVLDPKLRMTTKEMLQHPFLTNEDIPKVLSVEAFLFVYSDSRRFRLSKWRTSPFYPKLNLCKS
jgi:serine/threonine protein kinase